jgi:hypothetical protein
MKNVLYYYNICPIYVNTTGSNINNINHSGDDDVADDDDYDLINLLKYSAEGPARG